MKNAISIDVEDYFQVSAFEKYINRDDWDKMPSRVEKNTYHILELLSNYNIKATFFILGWIAERYPVLVRTISSQGHEIACHGYSHIKAYLQEPDEFRNDVFSAKSILEDISGVRLRGYRAASYSIGSCNLWALEILEELGFDYSSSIYPIKHDIYGMPSAPRFVFKPENANQLIEIPVSTISIFGKRFPCGGGGFFRLYPYEFSKWAINKVNNEEGQPCIFYFHPWEIDPGQPRQVGLDFRTRFRHYLNLSSMEEKLNKLMRDFNWDSIEKIFLSNKIV